MSSKPRKYSVPWQREDQNGTQHHLNFGRESVLPSNSSSYRALCRNHLNGRYGRGGADETLPRGSAILRFHEEPGRHTGQNSCTQSRPYRCSTCFTSKRILSCFFQPIKEQTIFDSIIEIVHQTQKYARCLHFMRDPNFWQAPGSARILRVGFFIHHRIASIITPEEKATYVNKLPHQIWALLCVFSKFILAIVSTFTSRVLTQIENVSGTKRDSIVFFIQELTIFSGLQVVKDFIELRQSSITFQATTGLYAWAHAFQSKYLPDGYSILLPRTRDDDLEFSSDLSTNVRRIASASIKIGSDTPHCFDDYFVDELLTVSGILPPNTEGCALFDALKKIPITNECYRTIPVEQLSFEWDGRTYR